MKKISNKSIAVKAVLENTNLSGSQIGKIFGLSRQRINQIKKGNPRYKRAVDKPPIDDNSGQNYNKVKVEELKLNNKKNMDYKITILVEDEDDNEVCRLSTTAGMADFEENVIRKAEQSIKEYEERKEIEAEMAAERAAEDMEEGFLEEEEFERMERAEADAVDQKIDTDKEDRISPTGL